MVRTVPYKITLRTECLPDVNHHAGNIPYYMSVERIELLSPWTPANPTISRWASQLSDTIPHMALHRKAGDPAEESSSGLLLFLGRELAAFPPTRRRCLFPNQIPKLPVARLHANLTRVSMKANFHVPFMGTEGT